MSFLDSAKKKKNDDVSHFLIIPSTLSRKKCNTKECGKKEKKKQAKFLLPSELIFFREGGAAYSHGNLFNKKVLR